MGLPGAGWSENSTSEWVVLKEDNYVKNETI